MRPLLAVPLALWAVLLAYAPAVSAWFVKDDVFLLTDSTTDLLEAFGSPWLGGFYRPLARLAFGLQHAAFGLTPWPYHVVSLGLHLVACACVYRIARGLRADERTAVFAMALFGLHPAATEAVAWISGQMALAASTAMLAAVAVTLDAGTRRRRPWHLAGVAACTAVACLSYETGALTPILCGIAARFASPFAVSATTVAAMTVARTLIVGPAIGPYSSDFSLGNGAISIAYYAYLLLGGTAIGGRIVGYRPEEVLTVESFFLVFPPVLLVMTALAAVALWNQLRLERDGALSTIATFLMALAPLLPALFLEARPRRLLYPALAPVSIWWVDRLRDLASAPRFRSAAISILLVSALASTAVRAGDWNRAGDLERAATEYLASNLAEGVCAEVVVDVPNQVGDAVFFHARSAEALLRIGGVTLDRIYHRYESSTLAPEQTCDFALSPPGSLSPRMMDTLMYTRGRDWLR